MDSLPVGFCVLQVHLVLWSVGIEGAEFQEDLDGSLILCPGDSFGAFSLEFYRFVSVFYC